MREQSGPVQVSFDIKHLGLFLGVMDTDRLETLVNERILKLGPHVHIQCGLLVKLMILRFTSGSIPGGISDMDSFVCSLPANIFSKLGEPSCAQYQHVNRYVFADVLDRIADYGPGRFSAEIISSLVDCKSISTAHIDSSSFHFHGHPQWDLIEMSKSKRPLTSINLDNDEAITFGVADGPVRIVNGYSRDNRPDLPQINLFGLCARVAGIEQPVMIYQSPFHGNQNDSSRFMEFFDGDELKAVKQSFPNLKVLVGDSAAANADSVKACKESGIDLVTRLPDSRVKKDFENVRNGLLSLSKISIPVPAWSPEGALPQEVSYAWLGRHELKGKDGKYVTVQKILYVAEAMRSLKEASVSRKAEKELSEVQQKLEKLQSVPRSCLADATRDFQEVTKKLKLVMVDEPVFEEVLGYKTRGRPKADAVKQVTGVKVHATASINEIAVKEAVERELYYVVATTDLEIKHTAKEALQLYQTYHGQSDIESQWRDIKASGTFFDSLYLKTERRIRALIAVVNISLFYVRRVMTTVRYVLKKHNLSLSLKNTPDCQSPSWKTFLKFACGNTEDTRITISRTSVHMPYLFEGSIISLVAKEIGDEAMKYYSAAFYKKNAAMICASMMTHWKRIRTQRSTINIWPG